jgi:hypothetical protein
MLHSVIKFFLNMLDLELRRQVWDSQPNWTFQPPRLDLSAPQHPLALTWTDRLIPAKTAVEGGHPLACQQPPGPVQTPQQAATVEKYDRQPQADRYQYIKRPSYMVLDKWIQP